MIRRLLQSQGLVVGAGLVIGATSALESWAPLVALGGLAVLVMSFQRPTVPFALAFFGILMDARGMTALKVLGVPVTLSKVMVLFAVTAHITNALLTRRKIFRPMPGSAGMFAIVTTMILSLVNAVQPSLGYVDTIGVLMLVVMAHLIYEAVREEDVPWLLRFMSAVTLLVLMWTLFTQRKQGFFVTLDHAWQQRTSGAYGDPNAWSTCLLVTCPMLLGFLSTDKHWSSPLLLAGLVATFPACIFQSMSRAGLISFVIILPGIVYILRRQKGLLLVAGAAFVVMIPFIINVEAALLRYRTLLDPTLEADLGHGSLQERAALLKAGIQIFFENPVLGVGVGLFRMHASYVSAGGVWKIAHNSYVNVAAEQGIPGLLAHGFLGWQLLLASWNVANRSRTPATLAVGQGFFLSMLAFAAMAMTLNLATFAVAWFMLGLGLLVGRIGGAEAPRTPEERRGEALVLPSDPFEADTGWLMPPSGARSRP